MSEVTRSTATCCSASCLATASIPRTAPGSGAVAAEATRSPTALMASPVISSSAAAIWARSDSSPSSGTGPEAMGVIGPDGPGQVLGDGIENVRVARPENDVRAHAGRRLGDPAGGERGVPLAAAERLAAAQVPLPVVLCGRPARMRTRLRARPGADVVAPGLTQVTGDVSDDDGVVPVRQHHDVGGTPRRARGHLPQVRQRPYPDRAGDTGWQPPRQQDLAVRGDHYPAAIRRRGPRACRKHLGGTLGGA